MVEAVDTGQPSLIINAGSECFQEQNVESFKKRKG
jgi:hypothetical protein